MWQTGNLIGRIYRFTSRDIARVTGWMSGRILVGDVALCISLTGDAVNDYLLLDVFYNGLKTITRFSAYQAGVKTQWQPTEREYYLLMTGESICLSASEKHPLYAELNKLRIDAR